MSEQIERDIEAILEGRVGRGCVFMPSDRFAIHRFPDDPLACERILMSPLQGDTAFFGALAVGSGPS
jgi:hypothetical protein